MSADFWTSDHLSEEATLHHPVPAQDNHVRKHDENWTTKEGVTKGGKDINTFRGKYGEEGGG